MRLKIGTKIGIVFIIFFIEILLFMLIYFIVAREHEHYMQELQDEIEELDLIKSLQLRLTQVIMPVNDFLIAGADPNQEENFRELTAEVEALIGILDELKFDKVEEKELFEYIKEEYFQAKEIALKIFSFPEPVGNIEAGRLMEEMDSLAYDASMDAEKFHQFLHQEIEEIYSGQKRTKSLLNSIFIAGIFLNITLIMGSLIFFRRTISQPLISLRDTALEIGRGNFDKRVDIKLKDEIGDLGVAFNKMTQDLQETQIQLIQAEKIASLGELAAGVAHEIKNPLAIIIQGIEYLKSFISSDPTLVDTAQRIEKAALRADKIVKDLLNFSRQSLPEFKEVDISSVIEETLSLVEHQINLKNVKIIREFSPGLPRVKVDNNQMKQVFINILLNAVEAMPQGGTITISMKQVETQPQKNYLQITFTDTGGGIPEEVIQKVFDPFFSTKKKKGGTGLGLSVSRGIIEKHAGTISIETKVGKGTSVIVSLPC